jgi:hypothetical protein
VLGLLLGVDGEGKSSWQVRQVQGNVVAIVAWWWWWWW